MGRPFSFLCISVILGMILGCSLELTVNGYLLIGLLVLMILCVFFYEKYGLIFISLSFVLIGNYVFHNHMNNNTILKEYPLENLALMVEIKGVGIEHDRRIQYDVDLLKLMNYDKEMIINEKVRLQV